MSDQVKKLKTHLKLAFARIRAYNARVTSKKGVMGCESLMYGGELSRSLVSLAAFSFRAPVMAARMGGRKPCRFGLRRARSLTPSWAAARCESWSAVVHQARLEAIMATSLTLGTSAIREQDGLYSLNDLHRASGGEAKHEPYQFIRLEQTQALIAEIKSADSRNCVLTKRGANGGTYACRELVIAYAAWISATFHLKVIRVFLAQQSKPEKAPAPYAAPTMQMTKTHGEILNIKALCNLTLLGAERWPDLYKALVAMRSPFTANFYDIFLDGKILACHVLGSFANEIIEAERQQPEERHRRPGICLKFEEKK